MPSLNYYISLFMYNMNIITYTSAVSMQPKQIMVAIYNDTKTLEIVRLPRVERPLNRSTVP